MNPKVKLNSGYEIPIVGLGVFQTPSDVAEATVYNALKLGYRHIDSAQAYKNEQEVVNAIVKFLKEYPEVKREDIFFTTKVNTREFLGYELAKGAIATSLKIAEPLGYIDLFLVHSPKGNAEKRLGIYKALQEAAEAGSIKSIGVSNFGVHHLKELLDWSELKIRPAVNQIELHPWMTRTKIVEFCESEGIYLEAWGPLTRALKLGEPDLLSLAKKYGKTPAQVLVRWSIDKGFITLPKSVHQERLVENFDVFDFKLTDAEVKELSHDDEYFITAPPFDPSTWSLDNE